MNFNCLGKEGYDRQFGARPLRRAVQRLIEDPLVERLLMGEYNSGETIYVDAQDGEMVFTTEKPEDGGEVLVAAGADGEGNEPPSADEQVSPDKRMSDESSVDESGPLLFVLV